MSQSEPQTILDTTKEEGRIPILSLETNEVIYWATETQCRVILKLHLGVLVRDRHGSLRKIYLRPVPINGGLPVSDEVLLPKGSGIFTSGAQRNIRREQLTAPLWCFSHIREDLDTKLKITHEELAADSIIPKETN